MPEVFSPPHPQLLENEREVAPALRRLNLIERILLRLSFTDLHLILQCPRHELGRRLLVGAMVLVTGAVSFCSMTYAFQMIFGKPYFSLPAGLLWACFILILDRTIITHLSPFSESSPGGLSLLQGLVPVGLRFLVGCVVALIVSIPLELMLFEKEISRHLGEGKQAEIGAKVRAAMIAFDSLAAEREAAARFRSARLDSLRQATLEHLSRISREERAPITRREEWTDSMGRVRYKASEAGNQAVPILLRQSEALASEAVRLAAEIAGLRRAADSLNLEKLSLGEKLSQETDSEEFLSIGILDRYHALREITASDASKKAFHLLVRILIISIELMPALLKFLMRDQVYEWLVYKSFLPRMK